MFRESQRAVFRNMESSLFADFLKYSSKVDLVKMEELCCYGNNRPGMATLVVAHRRLAGQPTPTGYKCAGESLDDEMLAHLAETNSVEGEILEAVESNVRTALESSYSPTSPHLRRKESRSSSVQSFR